MKITSSAFNNNEMIPKKYTCDGDDVNPPLEISEVPEETKSLVLIVDDPDAPVGLWIHWTLWGIDPKTTEIKENSVPEGAVQGITSSAKLAYGGPCPPDGEHRYFFKMYALDIDLDLIPETTKEELEVAMVAHILDRAELIGVYDRI